VAPDGPDTRVRGHDVGPLSAVYVGLGDLGRVSVSKDALPVVVPVIYIRDGSEIAFHASLDAAVAKLCDPAVIGFEVDGLSGDGDSERSVHVVGVASMLTDAEGRR
jgi:nitroimidazol reductase NimA-like FMN-containing flavoprotein (pyridoxamine 5'-phosphate oxidase superfamily)